MCVTRCKWPDRHKKVKEKTFFFGNFEERKDNKNYDDVDGHMSIRPLKAYLIIRKNKAIKY